jgi:predicted cation transporter
MSIEVVIGLFGIFVTVVLQALYVAYKLGGLEQKLVALEVKQDKHNNIIERMVRVEDKLSSAHKRLDELNEVQHDCIFRRKG